MCEPKQIAKYIGRYLGRPVIAAKRTDKYDGENVTFHYNRHEVEKRIVETIPAVEFTERLVQHIPEKNFKMIRYYGIYARHRESDNILFRAISKQKHTILLTFNGWRDPKRDLDFLDLFFIQILLLKSCIILDFPAQCRYYPLSCKTDKKNHLCLYLLHLVKIQFLQLWQLFLPHLL